MQGFGNRRWAAGLMLASMLVLAGCASPSGPVPVEDRGIMARGNGSATPPAPGLPPITTDASGKPLPGIENYGKPGYYAVRPGDTIRRIANETGQTWQNIARWNNLDNPDLIEVGQVLRVIAPGATVAATAPATVEPNGVVTRPVAPQPTVTPSSPTAPVAAASAPAKPATPPAAASGDEDLGWIWPAHGTLIAGFDEAKNKGLDISGKAGDSVLAAADGRVVYAGAGLRGYGNLIILKHNNTYLTAYAHNQALLVKEDQSVQKGQKIAEMGNSDADRVKLHFEIRRQGKPVDPARYLPSRQ
ncbi:peptidoglycan DD-metalloendopeptidase family protein [Variovorax arabinosiphilus]|uniref:peptidoglycan DD-metalloendopeptidase family protein n=1 Tax=Variovorax arabinosiphilus TaxID=3053498 RepID=UPI002579050E|nr:MULTISPECIES: peptidoglycan DD-metalloendopeptidase family protein [unclassified Variovorax]MDM0120189.1 peptidoglycan DD-metalloendopeptidase family protein [Variovorax sp. J2L1-78]MDM0127899.1 peptidoglycan DD-metalloendopeptidase family protein [Variovorax sp. J2L1-63]MDM0231598.1 peptidoglycan DD-metalloendopeptidase family protein [Variovorax sp. J2R1-6]